MERSRARKPKPERRPSEPAKPKPKPATAHIAAAIGNQAFSRIARQETATTTDSRARELHAQAQRFWEADNFREAAALWERARETPGLTPAQNAMFLLNIGLCNLNLERYATAIFFFEEYLESPEADQATGQQRLAEARAGAGVPAEGVSERTARALHARADRAYNAGEYARALILWERGRHQRGITDSQRAAFLFNVGMCNLMLERYASAVAVFEEYLRIPGADREVGENRLLRARAGVGSRELSDAPLQQFDDEPGEALHRQAQRFWDAGNYREALAVWERAREVPGVTAAQAAMLLFNIGMCNLRLERFATAVFFFEEYLESPGANQELARERLTEARRGAGVSERGVSEGTARSLHAQAQQAFNAGEYARALILWERARHMRGATDEQRAAFLLNIGLSNLRMERYGSAVAAFEEYLRTPGADREEGEDLLARARAGLGSPVAP